MSRIKSKIQNSGEKKRAAMSVIGSLIKSSKKNEKTLIHVGHKFKTVKNIVIIFPNITKVVYTLVEE